MRWPAPAPRWSSLMVWVAIAIPGGSRSAHFPAATLVLPSIIVASRRPRTIQARRVQSSFAADLLALLDHLDIDQAVIIAQSMGGWTALELALMAPARIAGLVLSGTSGSLRHPDIVTLAEAGAGPQSKLCQEHGILPSAGLRMAREQADLYQMYLGIDRQSGTWSRPAMRASLDAMRTREPSQFAGLTFPIQAIVGEEDIVCPPANIEILASALPNVSLAKVPAAGHSVYFECAMAFNEITLDYLRRIETI